MQWYELPGLRKHKRGSDSAKKTATEYSDVLSLKKKKGRRKWKENKEKNELACASELSYKLLLAVQEFCWISFYDCRSSLA